MKRSSSTLRLSDAPHPACCGFHSLRQYSFCAGDRARPLHRQARPKLFVEAGEHDRRRGLQRIRAGPELPNVAKRGRSRSPRLEALAHDRQAR